MKSTVLSREELVDALTAATSSAVTALFEEFPGDHFYYCSLVTTGEVLPPSLVAWSWEALDEAVRQRRGKPNARELLKWSYADSPFYAYGEEHFEEVGRLFDALGEPDLNDDEAWQAAYDLKMGAMEEAMARVDRAGLFGTGTRRAGVVINVEVMPPDRTNVERALRLNPREALTDWLREAAERE